MNTEYDKDKWTKGDRILCIVLKLLPFVLMIICGISVYALVEKTVLSVDETNRGLAPVEIEYGTILDKEYVPSTHVSGYGYGSGVDLTTGKYVNGNWGYFSSYVPEKHIIKIEWKYTDDTTSSKTYHVTEEVYNKYKVGDRCLKNWK